jgi:hypothetical protein
MSQILITGGAGYIGSMLATKLVLLGHKVTVVDKLIYSKNSLNHLFFYTNFKLIKKDIRDKYFNKKFFNKFEFIIPLAALVGAPLCEKNKKLAIAINYNAILSLVKKIHKKHEEKSRAILERVLKAPFTSVRPAFLKYIHGKNLELDGYNANMKVAFEYQGIQHRQFTPLFHKTYTDFQKQVDRDKWKAETCAKKGIKL